MCFGINKAEKLPGASPTVRHHCAEGAGAVVAQFGGNLVDGPAARRQGHGARQDDLLAPLGKGAAQLPAETAALRCAGWRPCRAPSRPGFRGAWGRRARPAQAQALVAWQLHAQAHAAGAAARRDQGAQVALTVQGLGGSGVPSARPASAHQGAQQVGHLQHAHWRQGVLLSRATAGPQRPCGW